MKNRLRKMFGSLLSRKPPELQVGALCRDNATGKVLLITSRGTGRWVIPKGWPMAGKTLAQAAQQEAWEEAGVRGKVSETRIGSYRYLKMQDCGRFGIPVEVWVFPLNVSKLAQEFPETAERERAWFTPLEAADLVDEDGLKDLLRGGYPNAGIDPRNGPSANAIRA